MCQDVFCRARPQMKCRTAATCKYAAERMAQEMGQCGSIRNKAIIYRIGLIEVPLCYIIKLLLQTMGSSICPIAWREVITIGRNESSTTSTAGKRTYTVVEVMEILGVSRKKAYELCNSGSFKIVRIGRSIRVSKSSFDEWLDKQS